MRPIRSITRWILAVTLTIATFLPASAKVTLGDETINYKVKYKWGLVNKHAGNVSIRLQRKANEYHARLTAASQPWADRFYRLRDTLNGTMRVTDLRPSFYEKIANEGSERKHDIVRFSFNGKTASADCSRKVWKKGHQTVNETRSLAAEGTTVDMLSAYYYMRTLPYAEWKPGHKVTVNIFSGKRKELLTIEYHGIQAVSTENKEFECYYISFIFTSDGKQKSSDDMEAWITTDSRRIPVRLEGKLPVGKVQCFYTGN